MVLMMWAWHSLLLANKCLQYCGDFRDPPCGGGQVLATDAELGRKTWEESIKELVVNIAYGEGLSEDCKAASVSILGRF
jgi:hypothetical protein